MKRFIIFIIGCILLTACGTTQYATNDVPYTSEDINVRGILEQSYPDLIPYYDQKVLRVTSIRKSGVASDPEYTLKYKFVKYYYNRYNGEMAACLHDVYPQLYEWYIKGIIEVRYLYKFVDNNGIIRHCVSYTNAYRSYYVYRPIRHSMTHYWYYHQPRHSRPNMMYNLPKPQHHHGRRR